MKLITFLMTSQSIKEKLSGDRLLIELCDLWDEFQAVEEDRSTDDILEALKNMHRFNSTSAKLSVENKIVKYLKEVTGNNSYHIDNALHNFSLFFTVIDEPREWLFSDVADSPTSY